MSKDYKNQKWWLNEVESRCKQAQKGIERFKKSDIRFKKLLLFSFIVVGVGIFIGFLFQDTSTTVLTGKITDNNTVVILKETSYGIAPRIIRSFETLIMFVTGIIVGFTIDEYRNRTTIIEESCFLRPQKLEGMVEELRKGNTIDSPQASKCLSQIQNGAAQMSKSGNEGFIALKDVVNNILNEIK